MSRTTRKTAMKWTVFKWVRTMEHKHFRQVTKMRIRAGRELLPLRIREYKARWGLCGFGEGYQKDVPQEEFE